MSIETEYPEVYEKMDDLTTLIETMWLAGKVGDMIKFDADHAKVGELGFTIARLMENLEPKEK